MPAHRANALCEVAEAKAVFVACSGMQTTQVRRIVDELCRRGPWVSAPFSCADSVLPALTQGIPQHWEAIAAAQGEIVVYAALFITLYIGAFLLGGFAPPNTHEPNMASDGDGNMRYRCTAVSFVVFLTFANHPRRHAPPALGRGHPRTQIRCDCPHWEVRPSVTGKCFFSVRSFYAGYILGLVFAVFNIFVAVMYRLTGSTLPRESDQLVVLWRFRWLPPFNTLIFILRRDLRRVAQLRRRPERAVVTTTTTIRGRHHHRPSRAIVRPLPGALNGEG